MMNDANPERVDVQQVKEHVYERFEFECRKNKNFRIEDLLPLLDDLVRPFGVDPSDSDFIQELLAELIQIEMELKARSPGEIDRFEYHRRFPDFVTVIDQSLRRVQKLLESSRAVVMTVSMDDDYQNRATEEWQIDEEGTQELPHRLPPYEELQEIGSGGFGIVCRAIDRRNGNPVAIKFPRKKVLRNDNLLQLFLKEADQVMKLDHPGIIKTFSVERIDGFLVIVQQLVEGTDLKKSLKNHLLRSQPEIAELVARIADALAYANRAGIVHRDLKPSNILLDEDDRPYIADFGMALDESTELSEPNVRCGTVPYMSPQLAAGLTRNLDGRTDIWSLGVILYEMLAQRRPFRGNTEKDIFEQIETRDPKPLRQIDSTIDRELERICLKALEKRARDRYLTADDLADDLRHWIQRPDTPEPPAAIADFVPKGLRSYGPEDSDFFLDLLPGTRDRNNTPASIRFWKVRVCEPVADENRVPVGVIYGPSGSGKSSFIKAGLLPQLDLSIIAVYIESTPADTEVRLIKALRRRFPAIPQDISLPELFADLSHGRWQSPAKKILVVVDQFEQRLSLADNYQHSQLARALRHCDGEHLQCLLLIRDDFWLALTRFADALEMDLLEGRNSQDIDLFDQTHAKKVLARLGRAYGCLPEETSELKNNQRVFLEKVIDQLAVGNHVICVRLSLFAEMFKSRPWTTAELKSVGGAQGVGQKFMEETFGSGSASRRYQMQRDSAQAVLGALLPESGSDIRGSMKSESDLLAAAKLENRPDKFKDLLKSLDQELKLITCTDPDATGAVTNEIESPKNKAYFQLTHDYLVPSLRAWLTKGMSKSMRGRALLRIRELSELKSTGLNSTPGLWELVRISALVPRHQRSESGQDIIRHGWQHYQYPMIGTTLLILLVGLIGFRVYQDDQERRAQSAKRALLDCIPSELGQKLEWAKPYSQRLLDDFSNLLDDPDPRVKLRATYAISEFSTPEPRVFDILVNSLSDVEDDQLPNIRRALANWPQRSKQQLDTAFHQATEEQSRAKFALMALALGDPEQAESLFLDPRDPTAATLFSHTLRDWHLDLQQLAELTKQSRNSEFQYGMLIAVGLIEPKTLRPEEFEDWSRLINEFFLVHSDSGVHSACAWVATKWQGIDLPELSASPYPDPERNWWIKQVAGNPLTLIRITGKEFPADDPDDRLDGEFWICDRELPIDLAKKWKDSLEELDPRRIAIESHPIWNDKSSDTSNYPFCKTTGNDIVQLLNWLSTSDGLGERYEKTPVKGKPGFYWSLKDELAAGYRAPTEKEARYCCGAGSDSQVVEFFWGQDSLKNLASDYGNRYEMILEEGRVLESARLIPNRLGFFDIVGNVREYCGPVVPEDERIRCHTFGGDCASQLWEFMTKGNRTTRADLLLEHFGVRPVYAPALRSSGDSLQIKTD